MSDCKLERGAGSAPPKDIDTPLRCGQCGGPIPASTALTFEGADYLRHFCGEQCLADWCADSASSRKPGEG